VKFIFILFNNIKQMPTNKKQSTKDDIVLTKVEAPYSITFKNKKSFIQMENLGPLISRTSRNLSFFEGKRITDFIPGFISALEQTITLNPIAAEKAAANAKKDAENAKKAAANAKKTAANAKKTA
jgi:hypothetical protein